LAGAELNAACVIAGLKALRKNPLADYFSAKAKEVSKAEVSNRIDHDIVYSAVLA
jgi:hypothetical protein